MSVFVWGRGGGGVRHQSRIKNKDLYTSYDVITRNKSEHEVEDDNERDLIDKDIAHMLVHSFVTSRLDYCNCLYAGVPFYLLERLQKIQNKAARLVLRKDRKHDSKELLRLLHWLPVQKRIDFKIACLVFKSLKNLSPTYIQDLIEIYKPTRTLRSSASISLKTPIPPNAFVGRAFSFNAPKIWNNLSHGTRSCASLQSFKKCLKTEFFKSYFI